MGGGGDFGISTGEGGCTANPFQGGVDIFCHHTMQNNSHNHTNHSGVLYKFAVTGFVYL